MNRLFRTPTRVSPALLPFRLFLSLSSLCLIGVGCSKKEPLETGRQLDMDGKPSLVTNSNVTISDTPISNATISNATISDAPIYNTIEWTDLLPSEDLQALENPPEYLGQIADGSEGDQLASQLKVDSPSDTNSSSAINASSSDVGARYQQALISKQIRAEFNGRHIRIPGFIVPLEFDDHETITTFFLVPFFGACLHLPPPPPNQIIYAEYEPGIRLEALYDPFWIEGTLSTTLVENDLATAAYSLSVSTIAPYVETSTQ